MSQISFNDTLNQISYKVKGLNQIEKAKSKQQLKSVEKVIEYNNNLNQTAMDKLAFRAAIAKGTMNIRT